MLALSMLLKPYPVDARCFATLASCELKLAHFGHNITFVRLSHNTIPNPRARFPFQLFTSYSLHRSERFDAPFDQVRRRWAIQERAKVSASNGVFPSLYIHQLKPCSLRQYEPVMFPPHTARLPGSLVDVPNEDAAEPFTFSACFQEGGGEEDPRLL